MPSRSLRLLVLDRLGPLRNVFNRVLLLMSIVLSCLLGLRKPSCRKLRLSWVWVVIHYRFQSKLVLTARNVVSPMA